MAIKAVFYFDDDSVTIHSENTKLVEKKFQPGYYFAQQGEQLSIEVIKFNEIHKPLPNQNLTLITDAISKFVNLENKKVCNDLGYVYKLNLLLHGKQGVGKTSYINYICNTLCEKYGAIAFRVDTPSNLAVSWSLAEKIRQIQDNLIVFIIDEFDNYAGKNNEGTIKNFLDGNRSIDFSIVLGCTNYLDRIPDTLKLRPSRFRVVEEIKMLDDKDEIFKIIKNIVNKTEVPILNDEQIHNLIEELGPTTIDTIKNHLQDIVMDINLDLPKTQNLGFGKSNIEKKKPIMNVDSTIDSFENPLDSVNIKWRLYDEDNHQYIDDGELIKDSNTNNENFKDDKEVIINVEKNYDIYPGRSTTKLSPVVKRNIE